MKYSIKYIITFSLITILTISAGCEKDEIVVPSVSLEIIADSLKVDKTITFNVIGDADLMVIWTGDENHDYAKRLPADEDLDQEKYVSKDAGVAVKDGKLEYIYKAAGTYEVVLIATNVGYVGGDVESSIKKQSITINE